jgi:hypothetical protein
MNSKLQITLCVLACGAYVLITALASAMLMSARSNRALRSATQTCSLTISNLTVRAAEHEYVLRALVQLEAQREVQKQ